MLKKIPVAELALGMYIHKICRRWTNDPFWIGLVEVMLDDVEVLKRIQQSGTREVWIETGKTRVQAPQTAPAPSIDDTAPASLDKEVLRARAICGRARNAVMAMFTEARMGQAMDVDNVQLLVEEISSSILRHPHALISLSRLKTSDEYTYMHSVAVCALMVALARRMGLPDDQVREAGVAGLMHDVGKMMIAPHVLNKPGRLTHDEFEIMKAHPELGLKILKENQPVAATVMDVCLHHHEKVDGSGYPHGLKGDQISIFARMAAVCDVYDAITSDRPYKKGWGVAHSIREMASWKGHFDDVVFQSFVKTVGIYPTGTLVRLESGRLGVVVEQSEASLLKPRVKVFMSARTGKTFAAQIIDLGSFADPDAIVKIETPTDWGMEEVDTLWAGSPA
ncbi:metal-dependent phosphohydrolase [Pseudomonas savastanoi pv. retacarpa]|uniref:HD-GYP domain-containing protein n=7 Tax=Pseudomonas syringae group TaxID=136849 RepID=A0A0P9Y3V7_PSESS|nr:MULTISPECIES: HD-GYP domain-containing protein [Pseudomonas]KPX02838.1 HDIG domain-containing protein [Pseudomonas syringae pv. cunninghamiae]EGH03163.1 HDIG domain-containing protein [Pseudomonas amygdali pv. aesculi str. 0893_23]KAA3547761.1 HD-GYP domain-containing protein [Pseudomonas savastanoi]KPB17413.1 HDIG domain protein [Pseudomonas savastanoi]KPC55811.1 HDIG domain-containing protein [Pseudomonas amygdali pv. morsprunorum]